MDLIELVKQYEDAKSAVEPIIKEKRMVLPIYRVEKDDEHFLGDGFFYSSENKLDWKVAMSGFDCAATPENLLEAYREFYNKDATMEFALSDATAKLIEWHKRLETGDYFLPGDRK